MTAAIIRYADATRMEPPSPSSSLFLPPPPSRPARSLSRSPCVGKYGRSADDRHAMSRWNAVAVVARLVARAPIRIARPLPLPTLRPTHVAGDHANVAWGVLPGGEEDGRLLAFADDRMSSSFVTESSRGIAFRDAAPPRATAMPPSRSQRMVVWLGLGTIAGKPMVIGCDVV